MEPIDLKGKPYRERGAAVVDYALTQAGFNGLGRALADQVLALASARLDMVKRAIVERDHAGNIVNADIKEISLLDDQIETMAGMIERLLTITAQYQFRYLAAEKRALEAEEKNASGGG